MTAVDWIIIGFVAVMALWGYGQGLVISGLSLAGFAAGAFAGSRLAPLLLDQGSSSPYAPLFSLVTALMVGGIAAIVFEAVGVGIRRRLAFPGADVVDGVGGAALVAALGLILVWILGAVALQTPGARQYREDIQRSAILRKLNEALPPSGPILNALARADPFPQITGPEADVPPPNRRILRDPDVQAARDSVVRVLGTACGLAIQGSGWVAAPGGRRHERPRRRGRGRHDGEAERRRRARRAGNRVRPPQRPRRPAGAGPGGSAPRAAHAGHRR